MINEYKMMISVIIPVYNVVRYLSECIDSILVQTYSDFELLLIDDGCTDGSGVICDEYAIQDKRIKVMHIVNGGVTAARKLGVETAKGEWITFVDADDTLPIDAFERFAKYFKVETDIIIGSININRKIVTECYDIDYYRRGCLNGKVRVDACGKMIRHSLFKNSVLNIPREIKVGEDMLMHIRLSFQTNKDVYFLTYPNHVYNYRSHEGQCSKIFKRSLDYEVLFHKYLKESIPSREWDKYLEATIKSRLNALRMVMMSSSKILDLRTHPFYTELYGDIKRISYSLSWRDKLFLKANNKYFRTILISVVSFYIKMKRK